MRRPLQSLVCPLLALAMIPGLGEVGEAIVHLAETGHVAHAAVHHDDAPTPEGTEHGCNGTYHFCGCCPRVAFALGPPSELLVPAGRAYAEPELYTFPVTEGHVRDLLRPPRLAA